MNSISIFLGAGFSKWAFDLPLVSQLFDFDILTTSEQEQKWLNLVENDWKLWSEANPDDTPEKFVYWCMNKSTHRRSRIIWYVNRRLTEPFMTRIRGSYSAVMFDERVIRENGRILSIKTFFSTLSKLGLIGILTCNYDTLVECVLGTSGFNYGIQGEQLWGRGRNPQFPWQNAHAKVTGCLPLVKLHGSLSWAPEAKFTSGKPGREGKALIVPPAPEKLPPKTLEAVWALGANILRDSECLIVFGFAFNPYDEALLRFLSENGSSLKKVLLIDPSPNIESAQNVWSQCVINTIDPRVEFNLASHKWFSPVN